LLAYPFKAYQLAYQGIERPALAEFHFSQMCRDWAHEPRDGAWFAVEAPVADGTGTRTAGFGRLVRSDRHSRILGRPFYRFRPILIRPEYPEAVEDLLAAALEAFRGEGGEVLEFRVDEMDLDTRSVLTRSGFRPLGTSVKLSARGADIVFSKTQADPECEITEAGENDIPPIVDIVRGAHVTSHYFNGGVFEPSRVRDLFADWSERCVKGLAERVLIAREAGNVLGFVTLLVNRGIAGCAGTPIGVIDFVAVRPESQGRGIGSGLLRAALKSLAETCRLYEVRTELDNYPAIRTYSKFGFRLTSADQVFLFVRH
jgi:ribosomal protein S18 acetylase RimI-like enzyme